MRYCTKRDLAHPDGMRPRSGWRAGTRIRLLAHALALALALLSLCGSVVDGGNLARAKGRHDCTLANRGLVHGPGAFIVL